MNHKQLSKLALALGAMVMAGGAMAVPTSDTATADASVEIISPISIAKGTDLVFGQVAKPNSGASKTVIVTTGGSRDAASTSDAVGTPQTVSAASFTVTADEDFAYTATVSYVSEIGTGATLGTVVAKCGSAGDVSISVAAGTPVSCAAEVTGLTVGGTLTLTDAVATGPVSKAAAITVVVAYD